MIKTMSDAKNSFENFSPYDYELIEVDVEKEIEEFPLHVYGERVYVVEEVITKAGSIYVPESAQKGGEMQTNIGYVVAVGPDCTFVKLRDRIFYGRYSGSWVLDKKYRVMNQEDILGVFK